MSTSIRIRGFSGPRFRAAFLLPAVLLVAGLFPVCAATTAADSPPSVMLAAAASLERVFEREIIPAFRESNPEITVEATYDSSGKLQTQIENGLAADVFMSAATTQMDALLSKGFISPDSVVPFLENKIVLIRPASGDSTVTTFADAARAGVVAVGDPESVPAGQYAREAFTSLGVWEEVAAKASFGSNVTEVLNWVAEGSAELGVVYATDAASTDRVAVICEAPARSLAKEVVYPVGMLSASAHPAAAGRFLSFLTSDAALAAFRKYGFSVSAGLAAAPTAPAGSR